MKAVHAIISSFVAILLLLAAGLVGSLVEEAGYHSHAIFFWLGMVTATTAFVAHLVIAAVLQFIASFFDKGQLCSRSGHIDA